MPQSPFSQYYIIHPNTIHHHINNKDCISNLEHCLQTSIIHLHQLCCVKNANDQTIVNQTLALIDINYKQAEISERINTMIHAIIQLMVNHDLNYLLFYTPNSPKLPPALSTPSIPFSKVQSPSTFTDLSYDSDWPVEKPRTDTNIDWKKQKPPPQQW